MTPLFWVSATALLLVAAGFLAAPLWGGRHPGEKRSWKAPCASLAVVPIALGIYFVVTSYDADLDFEQGRNPEVIAMLEQLAARLGTNPDDVDGWTLLGRSYMELGEYELARAALQEAWTRTATPDDSLKLAYAEALLQSDPATALTIAGELIDEVLVTSPDNQRALWWGGLVAVERNAPALAAQRWTALLATNPPEEVAELLREQIVALAAAAGGPAPVAAGADGPLLAIEIAIAPAMPVATLSPTAVVYLLARAPEGGPPLAAKQIPLSALPGQFELGIADAMIPGRTIAGQDRVTIIARISLSGEPTEQPGDIFGQAEVDVASGEPVRITIDSIVPSA